MLFLHKKECVVDYRMKGMAKPKKIFKNGWFLKNGSSVISCFTTNEVTTYIYDLMKFYDTRNFVAGSRTNISWRDENLKINEPY